MKNDSQIELRSEKVRKLIGTIPSSLVFWGGVVIILIFIMLIAVITLFPYPYSNEETIIEHIFNVMN